MTKPWDPVKYKPPTVHNSPLQRLYAGNGKGFWFEYMQPDEIGIYEY